MPPYAVALKVDVDTLQGFLEGVPRLLVLFQRLALRATFCLAVGPDHSGRAIRRIFTRPGFLSKMIRTRAVSMYGWRTMFYGTLLPGPLIARSQPDLVREIEAQGHELIPHGWDHVAWHDHLVHWNVDRARAEIQRARDELTEITGRLSPAFAAPGWQATAASVQAEQDLGLIYVADTRGWSPFLPRLADGRPGTVIHLPTTLPTVDELAGLPQLKGVDLREHYLQLFRMPPCYSESPQNQPPDAGHLHIYTGHAEVEGRAWAAWFEGLLHELLSDGVAFVTLGQVAGQAAKRELPVHRISRGHLPGRAGAVSVQDPTS